MQNRFKILLLLYFFVCQTGYGLPWEIRKPVNEKIDQEFLYKQYPEIKSPQEMEHILNFIARSVPIRSLRTVLKDNKWVIEIEYERIVNSIDFNTFTRQYLRSLKGISQSFIGKTDSKELRKSLIENAYKFLAAKGFPNSRVQLKEWKDDQELNYIIDIDEKEPCYINEIKIAFKLPKNITFGMKQGELCDINKFEEEVDNLSNQLKEMGYINININFHKLSYAQGKTKGIIAIMGELGPKVKYRIIDLQNEFVKKLFSNDETKGLEPNRIDPDAMEIELEKRFQDNGYVDVKVYTEVDKNKDLDEVQYTYYVEKGPQYILGNITIEGAYAIDRNKALEIMNLDHFWNSSVYYSLNEIRDSIDNLKYYYQNLGFWQVKIEEPRTTKDKSTGIANITIVIFEGAQRVLGKVELEGLKSFNKYEIIGLLSPNSEDPLNYNDIVDFQQRVREFYFNQGYTNANISIKTIENKDRKDIPVDIHVTINEGSRYKIGSIQISGLTRTQQYVVEREILFKAGEWYEPSLIKSTRKALIDLGIFRTVQISTSISNETKQQIHTVEINIEVSEGNAGSIVFGPGYDINRGFTYSAEASYNNIAGTGRQFSVSSKLSEEKHQHSLNNKTLLGRKFGIGYVEPYLLDLPIDGRITLSHKATAELYWEFSHKGEFSLFHKFKGSSADDDLSLFYSRSINKAEGRPGQARFHVISDSKIAEVGLRYNRDSRDNKGWPTKGAFFSTEVSWAEYPLGGDLKYFRWDATNNFYLSFTSDLVLALGASATSYESIEVEGADRGLLPSSAGLNAGGPDMVRGFQYQLGPYIRRPVLTEDNSQISHYEQDIIGGDKRFILKAELRKRLDERIGVSIFIDSGNAFLSREQENRLESIFDEENDQHLGDASLEDNSQYELSDVFSNPTNLVTKNYYSYGTAVKVLTPIGSIDIAYALPWKEPENSSCEGEGNNCFKRAKTTKSFLYSGRWELSVGARF